MTKTLTDKEITALAAKVRINSGQHNFWKIEAQAKRCAEAEAKLKEVEELIMGPKFKLDYKKKIELFAERERTTRNSTIQKIRTNIKQIVGEK